MGKKTLRVPEGLELNELLRGALQSALDTGPNFEHDVDIERFSTEPNLLKSYHTRIKSLDNAYKFLCHAIPPQKNSARLNSCLKWGHEHYSLQPNATLEQCQAAVTSYATLLVDVISHLWSLDANEACKLLDSAEEYCMLPQERPLSATITGTTPDKQNLILIIDKPLAPFTEQTRHELKQIQTVYRVRSTNSTPSRLSLQSTLELKANIDEHLDEELFVDWELPSWFLALPETDRKLLSYTLQKMDLDNPQTAFFISSRLRTFPAPANLGEHQMVFINKLTGDVTKFKPRLRSAHLASRDLRHAPVAIRDLHTERNADRILECAKQIDPSNPNPTLFIGTLITPFTSGIQLLDDYINVPDYFLDQQRPHAIDYLEKKSTTVYSSNNPYNYVGRVFYYTPINDSGCLKILADARKHLEQAQSQPDCDQQYILSMNELITNLANTLDSGFGTSVFTGNGRELFLSSLADLLVTHMRGVSYGSCVSGKDRKAIQLIHTNAMQIFHQQYHHWPSFSDNGQKRENFVQIFAQLYQSHHYQLFSGQNAPGSDGIKTPNDYLPEDINATLGLNALRRDDRLASNNEVDKFVPKSNVSADFAYCLAATLRLNPDNTCRLISLLTLLVGQKKFWQSKTTKFFTTSQPPEGVTAMSNILGDPTPNSPSNSTPPPPVPLTMQQLQLAKIYLSVHMRPATHSYRSLETRTLYTQLKLLADAPNAANANERFDEVYQALEAILTRAYEYNAAHQSANSMSAEDPGASRLTPTSDFY